MQALIAPLKELAEYDEIRKVTRQGKGTVALSGCVDSQKLHMIYGLSDGLKYKVIVTYNDLKAKEIYEEYRFYDRNVMLYPAKDLIFFQADIHGNQLVQERIKTLRRVVEGKPVTIVTTYAALMTPQVLWEEKDIIHTCSKLTRSMVNRSTSFITIIYGEEITEAQANDAYNRIKSNISNDIEVTLVNGGQPVYYFIISVE